MNVPKKEPGKGTARLSSVLAKRDEDAAVEVVIELSGQAPALEGASRAEAIAARKEEFERAAGQVERFVADAGGEMTGRAWINRTLRGRVPVRALHRLSELDEVGALDAPEDIVAES